MSKENKEISQFLIWDYMEDMNKSNYCNTQKIINNSFQITAQEYKKYKIIIDSIDSICNIIFSLKLFKPSHQKFGSEGKEKSDTNKKILFGVLAKYPLIISAAKKNYLVEMIVKGKKDRLFAIKNFIKYTSYTDLNQFVYNYLIQKNERYLYEAINNIKEKIKRTNPDYIVLWNDSLPIERAIVLISRKLRIPTIVVQHGIDSSAPPSSEGKVADYILVWGKYFKDLYIKKNNRKPENIYVLGYPYSIEKREMSNKEDKPYTVYFLGENFESYDKKLLNIKIKAVTSINKICKELGMRFIYRFHPGDDTEMLKSRLLGIDFSLKNEKLSETFNKGNIFISFNSASLIEAAMRSKICLQLIDYSFQPDNFEKLGVCNKSFVKIEQLAEYLKVLSKLSSLDQEKLNFNNNYIETRYNPGKRFLEIIDDLEKSKL